MTHPTDEAATPAMEDGGAALEIAELTAMAELERLAPEWSALADRCPGATPFQLPSWQLAWWRCFVTGGDLRAVVVRQRGRLVGLAPMFVYGIPGQPRQLSLLASGFSDYDDWLLEPHIAVRGAELILRHLAERGTPWDVCTMRELRAGSSVLAARIPAELCAEVGAGSTCLVLELPRSADELHDGLSSGFRRKLRMAAHRLERGGAVEYVRADAATMPVLLDALFRLHEQRWNALDEPGVLADPRAQAFHRAVAADMLREGRLRLYGLRLDGEIIAVLYGFAYAGRMYSYLTGLDPSAGYYSPGIAVLRHAVEQAIADGASEFDMLRGEEAYKYLWGVCERPNTELVLRWAGERPAAPAGSVRDEPRT